MVRFFAKGFNYLFGKTLLRKNVAIIGTLDYLGRKQEIDPNYFDYIRLSTLELISSEISKKNLAGNVAELGVYKGKFAKHINRLFPGRKLYLFDTFEGFDQRDVASEKSQQFSSGDQNFSDTSVERVLHEMPFRDLCVPVKGFFPESAGNVDDHFVFVSLDADLYQPIYSGLVFFYPKLAKGGYIFIHDFNNENYKGAREAVTQFCQEQGIGYLPLPDTGGSAVIAK